MHTGCFSAGCGAACLVVQINILRIYAIIHALYLKKSLGAIATGQLVCVAYANIAWHRYILFLLYERTTSQE